MKLIRGITLPIVASAVLWGQPTPARLEFEVASIRPSAETAPSFLNVGIHIDGAQVRCTYLSLKDYLGIAYKMKVYQISGPEWLASARFDINAKLPDGATRQQVPDMLKALLESRFKITMHRDTKPYPVYALVVAKSGLKMNPLPEDAATGESAATASSPIDINVTGGREGVSMHLPNGASFGIGNNKLEAKRLPMMSLADMLSRFMDRPVVDMTELKGSYDFTLDIAPEDYRAMLIRSAVTAGVQLPPQALQLLDNASDSSLHAALQTLGLKLEPRKAPIEVLAIDHVEKTPTEN